MSYQQNPMVVILIIAVGLGGYLFFKAKKNNPGSSLGIFRSGNMPHNESIQDLTTFMLIQQLMGPTGHSIGNEPIIPINRKEDEIDKTKNEILKLLREK